MHSIVIQYFYALPNDLHSKSKYPLPPLQSYWLYSPGYHYHPMTYFLTGSLYLLILFTCFIAPNPVPSGNHLTCPLYPKSLFLFYSVVHLFVLDSTYKWNEVIQYLSSSIWLTSLSIIPFRFIRAVNDKLPFLSMVGSNTPLYVYAHMSFIHYQWKLRLLLYLGYCQ